MTSLLTKHLTQTDHNSIMKTLKTLIKMYEADEVKANSIYDIIVLKDQKKTVCNMSFLSTYPVTSSKLSTCEIALVKIYKMRASLIMCFRNNSDLCNILKEFISNIAIYLENHIKFHCYNIREDASSLYLSIDELDQYCRDIISL